MDFGDRLRKLRKERNLCQKELAKQLNVSVSTISNYERNIHFPDPNTLCKFADYYDVSIDYLMGRTKYRHSLNLLNRVLANGSDMADFVNTFVRLEFQTQQSICSYVNYLMRGQSGAKRSRRR